MQRRGSARRPAPRLARLKARARKFALCSSGSAFVEFLLVLPLFVTIVLGGFELGRAVHSYHKAEMAVRGAARYLARAPTSQCCTSGSAAYDRAQSNLTAELAASGSALELTEFTPAIAGGILTLNVEVTLSVPMLEPLGMGDFTMTFSYVQPTITE